HIFFEVGPRLLVSRMLYGQFPNYDMVMPKNNDKSVQFDCGLLNSAVRRVALMSDERSHAIRFHLEPNQLVISSQNAEEGETIELKRVRRSCFVSEQGRFRFLSYNERRSRHAHAKIH